MQVHHFGIKARYLEDIKKDMNIFGGTILQEDVFEPNFNTNNTAILMDNGIIYEYVVFQKHNTLDNGPYHLAYEVENMHESIKILEGAKQYKQIIPVVDSVLWGCKITYLYSRQFGFVELLERL